MTNSPNDPIFQLLDRYLAGELSASEQLAVEDYLASHPADALVLSEIGEFEAVAGMVEPSRSEKRQLFEKALMARMKNGVFSGLRPRRWVVGYVAAAAMLITTVIAVGVHMSGRTLNPSSATISKSYTTARGQRASITLADGSKVILAPVTTLRTSGPYGRSVELQGEAVFTVAQHSETPFTVRAGGTVIQVLGTTFGIKSYGNKVRVAVADGRVSAGRDLILSVNDVAVIHDSTTVVTRGAGVAPMFSWTTGTLEFNKVSAAEVFADINRWYGLDIRADKQTLARIITGAFTNETEEQMLDILSGLLEVNVLRDGHVVHLVRK